MGAVVSFRHLELDGWREEPRAPHGAAWGVAPRKGGRVVFYGDSITQGFCADEPYPEVLARMNNWEAINLGIGGMKTIGRHGKALGQLKADIVMLAIGTNDWWDCHDIEGAIGQLIDGVRQTQRTVPIVAVTPLVAHYEGTAKCGGGNGLEALRDQIRTAVSKRSGRDSKLYVVEGKALLPLTWMGDRLHPTSDGMRELARNINAEMGYGALRWRLPNGCVAGAATFSVEVEGATPHGALTAYVAAERHDTFFGPHSPLDGQCPGRHLIVADGRQKHVVADGSGRAHINVPVQGGSCASTLFQLLDAASCATTRVGSGKMENPIAGAVAENFLLRRRAAYTPPTAHAAVAGRRRRRMRRLRPRRCARRRPTAITQR